MKLQIGVMGSASDPLTAAHKKKAFDLGCAIAENDFVTITGACPGFPLEAARGAKSKGGLVVGISPALSEIEHIKKYKSPIIYHDVLIYTGSGLMGREVVNIRSSNIVIIIGGHSGTLGEFSIAYDEGNLIGVLEGTGGIASQIKSIVKKINKKTGAKILYDSNPRKLLDKLIKYYFNKHIKRPDVFSG
jgi:uncharacterized protein (TIGR00725 family)